MWRGKEGIEKGFVREQIVLRQGEMSYDLVKMDGENMREVFSSYFYRSYLLFF